MTRIHSLRSPHRSQALSIVTLSVWLFSIACASVVDADAARGSQDRSPIASDRHLIHDIPARTRSGLVNVLVEIPAGTNAKWEVVKSTGRLEWEQRSGRPRVIDYLPYPGNYGMVPQTLLPREQGGDGDPLDVIVLGPAVERGAVVAVRVIGVLGLLDGGERDDKLIAVQPGAPFGDLSELDELDQRYRSVSEIIRLWFESYKGPGRMEATGFRDRVEALEVLDASMAAYADNE